MTDLVGLEEVTKEYETGPKAFRAVDHVTMTIEKAEQTWRRPCPAEGSDERND
ncbi:MAG: hypothetical protein JSV90_09315 [Methanobacteriota archaeon]|nr:MAG: hypothetical protein JSV90_09315 [Euryarchaeota archaeon]